MALALVACGAAASEARAQQDVDADILGEGDEGLAVEEVRARANVFVQRGFQGYQSPYGPIRGPGSEEAFILEPQLGFRLRHDRRFRHDVTLEADIVSAASPDGVDVVASASRLNEAGEVDVVSTYVGDGFDFSARYGLHIEEHFRSFHAGAAYLGHFAEDNTLVGLSANVVYDTFDPLTVLGRDLGSVARGTSSLELQLGQLLSRTTVAELGYGIAYQAGVIETTWSSVPAERGEQDEAGSYPYFRLQEKMPDARFRHAISARLAQHVPLTHSTVKGEYRFYIDQFGLMAHTAELMVYQYLTSWLYVRGSYRTHDQTGVDFYMELAPADLSRNKNRTADSDLAPMATQEVGAKLVLHRPTAPRAIRDDDAIDVAYYFFRRTNELQVHMMSLGYNRTF